MADLRLLLEFLGESRDAEAAAKRTENAVGGVEGAVGKLGPAAAAAGVAIAAGLAAGAKAAFDLGASFDEQYDKIQAGTGATGERLRGLQDDFRAVASTARVGFDEVGSAITGLNQRLKLEGDALQGLSQQTIEFARLTKTDLNETIRLSTRLYGDWGIAAGDYEKTLDKLFVAHQKTGVSVSNLMQQVVQFGAPLRQLGFTFDESVALMAKFEAEGVNSELVMGSLRIAIGKMADAGVPFKEGFAAIVEAVKNAKTESEATGLAMELFGKRAGADMAAAIREGRLELGDLVTDLQGAGGEIDKTGKDTDDAAQTMQKALNNLGLAFEPVGTAVFGLVAQMADELFPHLQTAVKELLPMITAFGTDTPDATNKASTGISVVGQTIANLPGQIKGALEWVDSLNKKLLELERNIETGLSKLPIIGGMYDQYANRRGDYYPPSPGPIPVAPGSEDQAAIMEQRIRDAEARAIAIQHRAPLHPGTGDRQALAAYYASMYGIPQDVFLRQIGQESGFGTTGVSSAGARGIGQFMPGTAAGVSQRSGIPIEGIFGDVDMGLHAAAFHMRELLDANGGDVALALAAYNGGQGTANNLAAGRGIPGETSEYVRRILGGSRPNAGVGRGGGTGAGGAGAAIADRGALFGFESALPTFLRQQEFEIAMGDTGAAAAEALINALVSGTEASGRKLAEMPVKMAEALRKAGSPEWEETGKELENYLTTALAEKTPEAEQAAIAFITEVGQALAAAGGEQGTRAAGELMSKYKAEFVEQGRQSFAAIQKEQLDIFRTGQQDENIRRQRDIEDAERVDQRRQRDLDLQEQRNRQINDINERRRREDEANEEAHLERLSQIKQQRSEPVTQVQVEAARRESPLGFRIGQIGAGADPVGEENRRFEAAQDRLRKTRAQEDADRKAGWAQENADRAERDRREDASIITRRQKEDAERAHRKQQETALDIFQQGLFDARLAHEEELNLRAHQVAMARIAAENAARAGGSTDEEGEAILNGIASGGGISGELLGVGRNPSFLAGGARNFRGGLAVVGERGPELLNLPRGSDVIPNGARPTEQHIHVMLGGNREIGELIIDALSGRVRIEGALGAGYSSW